MRLLTEIEEKRLQVLTSYSVAATLLMPTATGLGKSIMDATFPVRRYLKDKHMHDYEAQNKGTESKVMMPAQLLKLDHAKESKASLYRPTTKNGDPRIWFKGLPDFTGPDHILAIIGHDEIIFVIDLTTTPLENLTEHQRGPIWNLLISIQRSESSVSNELLQRIKKISSHGWVPSVTEVRSDTSIGRTLEALLGIKMNSSKTPDYKGIELKAYRAQSKGRETRKNLFAQVANWELSKFKSSKEILEAFGYKRGTDFKLYCTVSARLRNSQGLQFFVNQSDDTLLENSAKTEVGDFAMWKMGDLRNRLLEKHAETFWVKASKKIDNGRESFMFTDILHTKRPIASQFDILLEQGVITMDHLIKRKPTGGVVEKGPLFKIETHAIELLFPPSVRYDLRDGV